MDIKKWNEIPGSRAVEGWPYTNLHDLNLDWIINTTKEFAAEISRFEDNVTEEVSGFEDRVTVKIGEFEGTIQEYTDKIDVAVATVNEKIEYIDNFFSSLDVQQEINNKLDSMARDGSLAALLRPFADAYMQQDAPGIISAWLAANITEPEGVVIDSSLTVPGAAADAAVTGENIFGLQNALSDILIPSYSWTEKALTFASTNGYWQRDGVYLAYAGMYKASFAATPGITYKLNGYSFWAACTIVFKNGENFVSGIVISESTNAFENYEFTIPQGVNICEIYKNGESTQFTLYRGTEGETVFLTADQVHYKELTTVDKILDDCTTPELRNESITFSAKSGYYEAAGAYYEFNNVYGAEIPVTAGEKYVLTGKNYYAIAAVCFFSSGNMFVSGLNFGENENDYNEEITIPSTASKMLIQKYKNDTVTNLYKYTGQYIYKKPLYTYKSLLNQKNITVIGDSITEYNYRAKTNWAMYLVNWTGAKVQNLGISGTGFANADPYINRISRIQTAPDIIGVAMSWNDMYTGLPAGNADDTGTNSLAGYANSFFDALITRYPTTPIICYCQGPWNSYRPGVTAADTWIAVLEKICHKKGVPFYDDLFFGSALRPWNPENREIYYKSDNDDLGNTGEVDGTHPNSIGHKVIARYLYPKFTQNIVADGMNYTAE